MSLIIIFCELSCERVRNFQYFLQYLNKISFTIELHENSNGVILALNVLQIIFSLKYYV